MARFAMARLGLTPFVSEALGAHTGWSRITRDRLHCNGIMFRLPPEGAKGQWHMPPRHAAALPSAPWQAHTATGHETVTASGILPSRDQKSLTRMVPGARTVTVTAIAVGSRTAGIGAPG